MSSNLKMSELREKAEQMNISVPFGITKDELAKLVESQEENAMDQETKAAAPVTAEPVTVEPEQPQKGGISDEMAISLMAANTAKEARAMLEAMQNQQPDGKRKSTPDAVIARSQQSDREAIRTAPKRKLTVPAGYIGCPDVITSCVNGHRLFIKTGVEVEVPEPHYKNITRQWKEKQKLMNRLKKKEQDLMKQ